VHSTQNPDAAPEAQQLAAAPPVDVVRSTDGKPPMLPGSTSVAVLTTEDVPGAAIDAGKTASGVLAESVRSGGQILYPKGTEVRVRVTRNEQGGAAVSLTALLVNGQEVPMTTNAFNISPINLKQRSALEGSRGGSRSVQYGGVRLNIPRIPTRGQPNTPQSQDRDRYLAANSHLFFITSADNSDTPTNLPTTAGRKKRAGQ
jgi:hypothetical protein